MIKVVLKRDQAHVLTETVIPTFPMSKSGYMHCRVICGGVIGNDHDDAAIAAWVPQ